ncbi:hypothetical protein BDV25DRAFT_148951 [Aspergillus avenaceus]|uniref:Zn(2)-C6 fungal-type domain-containing protein n=1 Tax=Aspergillus avenaceus TaxID=36643 RepID=A0A5N6U4X0_ASPAV|nr:hypothetical protein BDV25DRAFT_148951 [Aspergillus avenaceus]
MTNMNTSIAMDSHHVPISHADCGPKRLRRACNLCHRMKLRCSGTSPCSRCHDAGSDCVYSFAAKIGKPKGSRNKKTIARIQHQSTTGLERATVSPPLNPVRPLGPDLDGQGMTGSMLSPVTSLSDHTMFLNPELDSESQSAGIHQMPLPRGQNASVTSSYTSDPTLFDWAADLPSSVSAIDAFLVNECSAKETEPSQQSWITHQFDQLVQQQHDANHTGNCDCLRAQFESLCRTKGVETDQPHTRDDTNFATTLNALAVSQGLLDCYRCANDAETSMAIIMSVDLIFRRLETLATAPPDTLKELRLRLGDQEIVGPAPLSVMRETLIKLARDQVEQVFGRIQARIGRLFTQAQSVTNGDVDNLYSMQLQLGMMRLNILYQRLRASLI